MSRKWYSKLDCKGNMRWINWLIKKNQRTLKNKEIFSRVHLYSINFSINNNYDLTLAGIVVVAVVVCVFQIVVKTTLYNLNLFFPVIKFPYLYLNSRQPPVAFAPSPSTYGGKFTFVFFFFSGAISAECIFLHPNGFG